MKLAIVGSRNFHDYDSFLKNVNEVLISWNVSLYHFDEIVSGGASGTDTLAEKLSTTYNITMKIFPAEWNIYGRAAGPTRNSQIVNYSDFMIAFVAKDSVGTLDSIRKAQQKRIPLVIVNI